AVGQQVVHPASAVQRTTARWRSLPYIFDPGRHWPSSEFMARRIKNECPHMLRVPKFFQIVVGAALSTTLVRIHHFRQNLRTLALDPMPRRTERNRHQNRQHQEQCLGGPERQENLEEEALQLLPPKKALLAF